MPYFADRENNVPKVDNTFTPSKNTRYYMNDLFSVFADYLPELGRNVPVEYKNKLKGDVNNGKSSK